MERPIEPFNGNIVWSTVSMAKTKKSNYAKINIVNVRKALFKNKSNYGCNDALVDNRYIYLFFEGLKNWCFVHRGLWTHYHRDTNEFFTKMDHGKLIWKYRLNGLSRNFVSFNCTGRSASCFDCSIDRKTWQYVMTSWYCFHTS